MPESCQDCPFVEMLAEVEQQIQDSAIEFDRQVDATIDQMNERTLSKLDRTEEGAVKTVPIGRIYQAKLEQVEQIKAEYHDSISARTSSVQERKQAVLDGCDGQPSRLFGRMACGSQVISRQDRRRKGWPDA